MEIIDRKIAKARYARLATRAQPGPDPLSAEVARRHAEALEPVNLPAGRVLDAGCGSGAPPASICRAEQVVRLDWVRWPRAPDVVADAQRLPFAAGAFAVVWANLCLPWLGGLPQACAEARRVLRAGGLFAATSFGPDTLRELRELAGDEPPRTLAFMDMHDLADLLSHQGFAEPVAVRENISFKYSSAPGMLAELRTFGALARPDMARHVGHKAFARRLSARSGPLSVTFEVIYLHCWALAAREPKGPDGWRQLRFVR